MIDFAAARQNMVLSQLEPQQVSDPALTEAMATVPREKFVPEALAGVAYMDEDLEIVPGRYLMEPRVFARLLQAADAKSGDVALDVGCGTGYSSAVLAFLGVTVVALESDPELAGRATEVLTGLAVENAAVVTGTLAQGLPEQGPYDIILLGGSIPAAPEALCRQLAEGGRLLAVLNEDRVGKATVITRSGGLFSRQVLFDAGVPPLPGFEATTEFTF